MPQRVPTVSQISWPATIPQFAALGLAILVGWCFTRSENGMLAGASAYLVYSLAARQLIPSDHRRGVRQSLSQQYEQAIHSHKASYNFFTRHSWLDRYRSITMMSPSAMSFREMALVNIAFAYSQIGNGEKAKEYYLRTLDEFPESGMASSALRMIESAQQSSVKQGLKD